MGFVYQEKKHDIRLFMIMTQTTHLKLVLCMSFKSRFEIWAYFHSAKKKKNLTSFVHMKYGFWFTVKLYIIQ